MEGEGLRVEVSGPLGKVELLLRVSAFQVSDFGFWVDGVKCRGYISCCRVLSFGGWVSDFRFQVSGFSSRIFGFGVSGSRFQASDFGLGVSVSGSHQGSLCGPLRKVGAILVESERVSERESHLVRHLPHRRIACSEFQIYYSKVFAQWKPIKTVFSRFPPVIAGAATSQQTVSVPAIAPGAVRLSLYVESERVSERELHLVRHLIHRQIACSEFKIYYPLFVISTISPIVE